MENEIEQREERIVKLEATAKFLLVIFIVLSIILFFMVIPVAELISYVGVTSLIMIPLVGSIIVLISGFLIYHMLLVMCDMARSLLSIDDHIIKCIYTKHKQANIKDINCS